MGGWRGGTCDGSKEDVFLDPRVDVVIAMWLQW